MKQNTQNKFLFMVIILLFSFGLNTAVAQKALNFNADSQYVSFGEVADLDVSNITIEAWIKLDDYRPGVILAKPGAYYLRVDDNQRIDAAIYDYTTDKEWHSVTGTTQLDTNEFYQIVFSYNGSYLKLYLNGKQESNSDFSGNIDPLLTNGVFAGNQFFIDDYSDYPNAEDDTAMYGHENYSSHTPATALQEIDINNDRYHFSGDNDHNNVDDEAISYIKGFKALDYIVEVDQLFAQDEGITYISQRFNDVTNKYEVAVDPEWDSFTLNKVVNNVWTSLFSLWIGAEDPINNNEWNTVRTRITTISSTNNIKGWVNDNLYIDEDDPDLSYDGLAILVHDHDTQNFNYNIYFDNLKVWIPFKGNIDELRVFDTAVSQTNILSWMCRLVNNTHNNWNDLQGYWRFDDESNPTEDNSSNSNSGSIIGAAFVESKVPTGYANIYATGNNNITETAGVPVDLVWDGNGPGSSAVFNILQISDYPNVTTGLPENYPQVYWEITIDDDDGSFQADISFHYDNISGISNESALTLYQRNGPRNIWSEVSDYTINTEGDNGDGTGYITANNLTSFGQFMIASSSGDNSLPVCLSSFSGKMQKNVVILTWVTESEINNFGFEIERKRSDRDTAGLIWESIGLVEGFGNSNCRNEYSYVDTNPFLGSKLYYRLKQIDMDGSFSYSSVIEVFLNIPLEYSLEQNYPNPFNPITTIEYFIKEKSEVNLKVYDVLGKEISVLVHGVQDEGKYKIIFDGSNLSSGIYLYKLESRCLNGTESYISVNKMMIIK